MQKQTEAGPDLSWVVGKLSQYLCEPSTTPGDSKTCVEIFEGNCKSGTVLQKEGRIENLRHRVMPTGQQTKRQNESTCEAEYTALAATAQGSMYLVQLLNGMDSDCENAPATVFEDNQGAIALSKNPPSRQPCKHADIEYHFVRSALSCGKICRKYCPTADMVADALTKPVLRVRTDKFVCFNVWGKFKCQMYVMFRSCCQS